MRILAFILAIAPFAAAAQSVVDFMPLQPEELEIIDFAQDDEWGRDEPPASLASEASISKSQQNTAEAKPMNVNDLRRVKASAPLSLEVETPEESQPPTLPKQSNIHSITIPPASSGYVPLPNLVQEEQLEKRAMPPPVTILKLEDIDGFGILTPQNGGFEETVWDGLSREQVDTSLLRLQENGLKSRRAGQLLQRLLLTKSLTPVGNSDHSWLAMRAQTLQHLGYAEAARSLLVGLEKETVVQDGLLARTWVENRLMGGDIEKVCSFVRAHILNTDDVFWRQALLTCQGLETNGDALRLSLDLATEAEKKASPLLFQLLQSIADGSEAGPRLALEIKFSPLEATLYGAHPTLITPDVIVRLPDIILRRLAVNEALPISIRLQASEKLVNDNGQPEDINLLTKLYEIPTFDMTHMMDPIRQAEQEMDGSMARALLWQVAGEAPLPSTKAVSLQKLWIRAESDSLHDLGTYLMPKRRGIIPQATLAWFAPSVVRQALQSGQFPVATAWWQVLQGNRSLSTEIEQQKAKLAMAYAMVNQKLSQGQVEDWWQTQIQQEVLDPEYLQRDLSILEAAGLNVPNLIWQRMHLMFDDAHTEQSAGPGPLWLRLVANRLENQEVGAALMVLIEPFMYVSTAEISAQGVANIVSGLKFLGLMEDAMVIALEALLKEPEEF